MPRFTAVDFDPFGSQGPSQDPPAQSQPAGGDVAPKGNLRLVPVDHDPFAGADTPAKESSTTSAGMGDHFAALGNAVAQSFEKAGKDLMTGYQGSASEFYNTGANVLMLMDHAADHLVDQVEKIPGVPKIDRKTAFQTIEQYLRSAAQTVAPKAEDVSTDLSGKIYQGVGAAPAAIAEYTAGIKALGPILGFGATDAVRSADQGPEAAAEAGAKGMLLGGAFKAAEPLTRPLRASALSAVGATQAAADGGDASDVAANAVVMGALGSVGESGKVGLRDLAAKPVDTNAIKETYRAPALTPVDFDPFQADRAAAISQTPEQATPVRESATGEPNPVAESESAPVPRSLTEPHESPATERAATVVTPTPIKIGNADALLTQDGDRWRVLDPVSRNVLAEATDQQTAVAEAAQRLVTPGPRDATTNERQQPASTASRQEARGTTMRDAFQAALEFDRAQRDKARAQAKADEQRRPVTDATAVVQENAQPGSPTGVSRGTDAANDTALTQTAKGTDYGGALQQIRAPRAEEQPGDGTRTAVEMRTPDKQAMNDQPGADEPTAETAPVNSFAPGNTYVGFINDGTAARTAPADKVIRREDVLVPFLKALNLPLYQGRISGKHGEMGHYIPRREVVRIKNRSDLETTAHEIAHAIDDRVFGGFGNKGQGVGRPWLTGPKARVYAKELSGVSYDHSKVYEGFAEFVRLWMTQPEKARRVAPEFSQWWDRFTKTHEYGPALQQAQHDMTAWFGQDALNRAQSKIGEHRNVNEALDSVFSKFRQSVADDLEGVYRMERELTGNISPLGPYETARLTRASYSMAEGALTIGAPSVKPDGSFEFKGKGLQQILDPVANDVDNWTLYAVGRSASELLAQGREKLFTPAEVKAMVDLETPAFRKAFDDYQEWNTAVVNFAQRLGLVNFDSRIMWRREQYLPFHRVGQPRATRSKGGVQGNWDGIKALSGGTENIRDVLGNMIQNSATLMTAALRNEARVRIADMADKVRGGGRFMVRIPKEDRRIQIDKGQIRDALYRAIGIDPAVVRTGMVPEAAAKLVADMERAFAKAPEFMQVWLRGQAPFGDNVIAVLRDGKPDYYEVADPLLYRAISALNRAPQHWLVSFLNGFRRLGQASVTVSLDFMAANIARDTLMGGIISRHGFTPFVDSVRGMKSRIAKDAVYREFIANGGGLASHLLDEKAFRKHLEKFYTQKGIDYRTVIDAPSKVVYALETIADAFEMSTRLGEYRRARETGSHPRHAAYSAREVSTDFAMRGDSRTLGFFYDSVMFLKAGINGMDRLYRGVAHDPNRATIATKTALLALISMGLYAVNRDNPEYQSLEDWDRDTHWHFFIPKGDGTYHHLRYPKLWEIGGITSIAERTLDHLLRGELKGYAGEVGSIAANLFNFDYVPQALAPLYEQALNRNRFTGNSIETQELQSLQPFARAKPNTSTAFKEMGLATRDLPRELQVPPARLEALLRGYFNTWALYGLTLTDAALYDDKPEMRIDQYPVFRRFYEQSPAQHTKYEEVYYDMLREATELRRTMRYMDRVSRPDIANEIERKPETARYKQLNRVNEELQGIHREMRQVYSTDMSPEDKRRRLDTLTQEKNRLLQDTVTDVETQQPETVPGARQ